MYPILISSIMPRYSSSSYKPTQPQNIRPVPKMATLTVAVQVATVVLAHSNPAVPVVHHRSTPEWIRAYILKKARQWDAQALFMFNSRRTTLLVSINCQTNYSLKCFVWHIGPSLLARRVKKHSYPSLLHALYGVRSPSRHLDCGAMLGGPSLITAAMTFPLA